MTNFIPPVTGSLGAPINKENFLLKLVGAARHGAVHHHRETPRGEKEGSMKCRGGMHPRWAKHSQSLQNLCLQLQIKNPHILVLTEVSSCSNGLILPGFRKEIKRP